MGQISLDEKTTEKIDRLRVETGAQTRGEVIRNAVRVYAKQVAAENRDEAGDS